MKKRTFSVWTLMQAVRDRVIMHPAVLRLMLPFGHCLNPDRWIFVIGSYNAGTTLLAGILRNHPLIGGLHTEGSFLTDVLPYPERYGWPRMWSQCFDDIRISAQPEEQWRAERIKKHWSIWFPKDKPNLVEKSVANAARIPFLNTFFRPAYFLYIVRNGYAVAKGIQRKANVRRWNSPYKDKGYPIEMCAGQWKATDDVVEACKSRIANLLTITYEDLTHDCARTLARITGFLGLPEIPREVWQKKWSIHESRSPIRNMNPPALGALTTYEIEAIERQAAQTLRKYGYDRPDKP
ncbi:MAG: hypothetical protein GF344_07705 [Chitinivibrionales bacterium]|nr:hypothetical protein [Chitinivibrionales bacterium]MBD3356784.1 hypothetical protein [Chitinivibrionales bacterium]